MIAPSPKVDRVVVVLLLASLSANVYFAWRLYPPGRSGSRTGSSLRVGDSVPQFDASDVRGGFVSVRFEPGQPDTVFYAFSAQCSWCQKNWENVRAVALRRSDVRIYGVSLSPIDAAGVDELRLPFPVLVAPTPTTRAAYRLSATPFTVVVTDRGTVRAAWRGAYVGPVALEVSSYFGVPLPGVVPESKGSEP